jgi:hypothetical protein
MPLDTATITRRLAAAPSQQKDNEAQNIINGATTDELKNLNAEGVLRLFEALARLPPRIYSSRDQAAMKRLKDNTQFQPVTNTPEYGVELVRNARATLNSQLVTAQLVKNIYAAEDKRLSWGERVGIDGATIGRGQLGQDAYTDVKVGPLKSAFETCVTRVFIAELLAGAPDPTINIDFSKYRVIIPEKYRSVLYYKEIEDFVVAAYLAIKINAATKNGRTTQDTLRFAVAVYHGMRTMVVNAQTAVKDDINWSPVEAQLKSQGFTDEVAYVNEVVK